MSPDPQFANTLERGLRVLQCFDATHPCLGNRELAEMTGLPKPTVSRLTYTLLSLGYLRRQEGSLRFEVGLGTLCLGYSVLTRLALQRLALPHLQALADGVRGSATISVRDRLRMVTLESDTVDDVLGRRPAAGATLTVAGAGAGLGWLVGATERERERYLRELAHESPADVERVQADYLAGRQQMLKRGYVCKRATLRPDTTVVAMPLRRRPGDDLLVLTAVLHTTPPTASALELRAGKHLVLAGKRIAGELTAD